MKPAISVIIPCYNAPESVFRACIGSVLQQDFSDFEIILVDDGSQEEYAGVYDSVAAADERIRLFRTPNRGVSAARNFGLEQSTGDYIVYVDADDILVSCYFSEAMQIAREWDYDVVYGCNVHLDQFGPETQTTQLSSADLTVYEGEQLQTLRAYMVAGHFRFGGDLYIGRGPWNRLLKRSVAQKLTFDVSLSMFEDVVWNLQLLDVAQKICCVRRIWYLYNLGNTASAARLYRPDMVKKTEQGLMKVLPLLDLEQDREYKAFCDRCLQDIIRISKSLSCCKALPEWKEEVREFSDTVYHQEPWTMIGSKRYAGLCDGKERVKVQLYRSKLLIRYYLMKF